MGKMHYSSCNVAEFCCNFPVVNALFMGMRGTGSGLKIIFDWTSVVFCWNTSVVCFSAFPTEWICHFACSGNHQNTVWSFSLRSQILNNRFSLIYQVILRLVCCHLWIVMCIVFSLNSFLGLFIGPYFMESC